MTSIQDDTTTASAPVVQEESAKPMTAADQIRKALGRDGPTKLPPYVSGAGRTEENPNVTAAKNAAEEERKRKEAQEKAAQLLQPVPARQVHKDIKTSFPAPQPKVLAAETQVVPRPLAHLQPIHVVETCASILGLTMEDLRNKQRASMFSGSRQVIVYFVFRNTGCSLPTIGSAVNCHHTIGLYCSRKFGAILEFGVSRGKKTGELERKQLVELRMLYSYYEVELPPSKHWPVEAPTEAEAQTVQEEIRASAG